jgi:hypothetical protein
MCDGGLLPSEESAAVGEGHTGLVGAGPEARGSVSRLELRLDSMRVLAGGYVDGIQRHGGSAYAGEGTSGSGSRPSSK